MAYKLNNGIILRPESFGVVILKGGSNKVFFANKTATFILNQIVEGKNTPQLVDLVSKKFGKKSKKKIEQDVSLLLVLLTKNKIISEA